MASEPIFERLCLIGIGLIGASIAIRARRDGLVGHIAISTRSADTLARAEELELGDSYTTDAAEAVRDADCVIICTPVGAMGAVAEAIGPHLKPGCILSDAGSVKRSVIDQIAPHIADDIHFIPGHPIAGTEHSGPDAGFATLFDGRWHLLTPVRWNGRARRAKTHRLLAGARVRRRGHGPGPSRPGAGRHLPHSPPHRLQYRRHRQRHGRGDGKRGHQVFGFGLPRLHPHRGVRPCHVARRLPAQPRSGAGSAGAVFGRSGGAAEGRALGGRRASGGPFYQDARGAPLHRGDRAGHGCRQFRAQHYRSCKGGIRPKTNEAEPHVAVVQRQVDRGHILPVETACRPHPCHRLRQRRDRLCRIRVEAIGPIGQSVTVLQADADGSRQQPVR